MKYVSLKFSMKKQQCNQVDVPVLSLITNVRSQPWVPLIDGLVDDAVLQLSPDGDKALH